MSNQKKNEEKSGEKSLHELESKYNEQVTIRRRKLAALKEEGKDPFDVYKVERTHTSQEVKDNYEKLEGTQVIVAGRLMSKRVHGKAGFSDLQDRYGRIQLYIKIDAVGEEKLKEYKSFDIGDLLSVSGTTFVTQTGEITLHIVDFKLIAKSLKPLPEKWHGLKDPDLRYRQREVDIISNPQVKETFLKRIGIIKAIRQFLDDKGFLEVETPILSPIAGGAAARPFVTHH